MRTVKSYIHVLFCACYQNLLNALEFSLIILSKRQNGNKVKWFNQKTFVTDVGSGPHGLKHRILPNSSDFKLAISLIIQYFFSFSLFFKFSFLKRFYVCRRNGTRGTLSSDFQTKLDNLLKTLMHSKPHFVLCLKVKKKSMDSRKSEKTDNDIDVFFFKVKLQ